MSLKENINMVKEELNSEEKFFEKAVMTEKFVKKYKNVMIASVVAVVLVVGANFAYNMNEEGKVLAANEALSKLYSNPSDSAALSELKRLSPDLHDVWLYSQAIANNDTAALNSLKNSNAMIVSDLAKYELAGDPAALEEYASKQNAIYRDLALVKSAVMLLNENKVDKAKAVLSKVSAESSLNELVSVLKHYGVN
ncbi:hypothetical protein FCU45_05665 [Sulfurimonas crateris]|uniref:Tetratricopeptide repeat protein n=1 Tax=Sulfurimonas crateris TaxID=2574727 RepID=A0A4U2Z7R6_9BACT|nr:hypothetical protein [Sulfurimonas crateris]TKI69542.1 hypothetical protein FCU45_05665 [Sulfurimonas crateris]